MTAARPRPPRRRSPGGGARLLGLLALLLVPLAAWAAGVGDPATEEEDDELRLREVYIPLAEFHASPERDRLSIEHVTLIRVRRPDQSEALVAREDSGWEQVVLEGWRLTFYGQGRQQLRKGPGRQIIVQEWSGGAHCCFDYHVLHVEGVRVSREGVVRAGDCELRVADLDSDGGLELIACDSRFAYAFDLPFVDSPLVPMIYVLRDKGLAVENRRFPHVYQFRIAQERRRLAEAARTADPRGARRAVISILVHGLYAGRVTEAWCGFEKAYRWPDRARIRQEVLRRLRMAADPEEGRIPPVDLAYATAAPGRCP